MMALSLKLILDTKDCIPIDEHTGYRELAESSDLLHLKNCSHELFKAKIKGANPFAPVVLWCYIILEMDDTRRPALLEIFLPARLIARMERFTLKFSSAIREMAAPTKAPRITPPPNPTFMF